jgi:hypothetical protein
MEEVAAAAAGDQPSLLQGATLDFLMRSIERQADATSDTPLLLPLAVSTSSPPALSAAPPTALL